MGTASCAIAEEMINNQRAAAKAVAFLMIECLKFIS
jgi:hypothetical protein